MVWLDGLDIQIVKLLTPALPSPAPTTCSRSAGRKATASRASATTCCRSIGSRRSRPRRCSTTPTRAPARRSTRCPATASPTRITGTSCATSTRRAANSRCRRSAPSSSCCRAASRASPTARPTAPSLSASRARARRRQCRRRRHGAALGAARHLCRAELDAAHPSCRRRGGAVQLLRPAGAGKARPVARGARQRVINEFKGQVYDRRHPGACDGPGTACGPSL